MLGTAFIAVENITFSMQFINVIPILKNFVPPERDK